MTMEVAKKYQTEFSFFMKLVHGLTVGELP